MNNLRDDKAWFVWCPIHKTRTVRVNFEACAWHREGGHGQQPDPRCQGCEEWRRPFAEDGVRHVEVKP